MCLTSSSVILILSLQITRPRGQGGCPNLKGFSLKFWNTAQGWQGALDFPMSFLFYLLWGMHACVMMYPVWVAFVLMNTESCHTSSSLCPHGFLPCLPLSNTWVTFIAFWSWKKSVYGSTFTAFTSLMLAFLSLLSLPSNDSPIFDM